MIKGGLIEIVPPVLILFILFGLGLPFLFVLLASLIKVIFTKPKGIFQFNYMNEKGEKKKIIFRTKREGEIIKKNYEEFKKTS